MSNSVFPPQQPQQPQQSDALTLKKGIKGVKGVLQVVHGIHSGNPEKAIQNAIMTGVKMASSPFHNPLINPLTLAGELKKIGISVLGWLPETLMATLDQKFSGWTSEQISDAIESFHKTGVIKSDIPQLVREKIYAIRVVATSNSAQTEWHIFEKIGGAFNDRVVKFGAVEPLTASECARTVAIIENIRPDEYENEIKIYIAACCHQSGLYTTGPVKWISMSEQYLQQMNFETTGDPVDSQDKIKITEKFQQIKNSAKVLQEVGEDFVSVQATKLYAIDSYAEEVLSG